MLQNSMSMEGWQSPDRIIAGWFQWQHSQLCYNPIYMFVLVAFKIFLPICSAVQFISICYSAVYLRVYNISILGII